MQGTGRAARMGRGGMIDLEHARIGARGVQHAYQCAVLGKLLPLPIVYDENAAAVYLRDDDDVIQAVRIECADHVEINVAGTNQWRDWWRVNLRARKLDVGEGLGKWHTGIWRAGETVAEWGREAIKTGKPLHLHGHSMGGGACICAAMQIDARSGKMSLLALDPPRTIGNREALRASLMRLPQDALRVVSGASVVARVPPAFAGYRHPTSIRAIEIGHDGAVYDRERSAREWLADVVLSIGVPGLQVVQDHGIGRIIEVLDDLAAKQQHETRTT